LEFLRKRLVFLKELLTDDGSIYVHLDWRKGHYVKVLMDEIFGENHFRNEVVWCYGTMQTVKSKLANKHENIYIYSRSDKPVYNIVYEEYTDDYVARFRYEDEKGKFMVRSKTGQGDLTLEDEEKHPGETYRQYISEGALPKDWWEIDMLNSNALERIITGKYPTQKPERLLERIIKISSNEGDIVLDAFAGSGTTGAVAEKLGRKWIMIDSSKLAVYTMQKRMLNLKEEIGNKGRALRPKPFVLYNAGLYLDSGFIEKMDEADYKRFVLELFNAEPSDHKIKGVQMHGILENRPVMVFSQKDYLTHEFVDDLHKTVGSGLKDGMYIIVPQSVVRFNEDYIDKGKTRYHILRVPYSIIQKILERGFARGLQPLSRADINQTIESIGFDFIYPPKVECKYYEGKEKTLFDNLVIEIKKFEPVQISKKPIEFEDSKKEALSMVMIDEDYDGKVFDMDHYFFGDEIVKNNFKVVFPKQKAGKKIMIIYLDVLGNEKVEVKDIKDFKKKKK